MRITYLSHACFEFKTQNKTILIDPFFSGNELAPEYTGKPDLVLVTHSHFDHADAKRFDCTVVCPSTCKFKKAVFMKVGDKKVVEGINTEMISASHHQDPYPTGYIFELEGKRIAHLGDTYIDGVKKLPNIDLLLLPIGGYFTMNADEAVKALEVISPKLAIPMHYGTLPQIKTDPNEFKAKAEKKGFKVKILKIGETMAL
ncbi:MAG: metal-dependent hydrolase [Candidatus Atabeyarchaeum deiterrae]